MEIPEWWEDEPWNSPETFGDFRNNGESMDYVVFNCYGTVVIGRDEPAYSALQKLRSLQIAGVTLQHHLSNLYGIDLKFILEGGSYPVYISSDHRHSELRVFCHRESIKIPPCSTDETLKAISHLSLTPSQREKVTKAMAKMVAKYHSPKA